MAAAHLVAPGARRLSELAASFACDGAVVVRGLLTPEEVALATSAVERVLASPSPLALEAAPPGEGRFFEDFCNWQRIGHIDRLVRSSPVAALAGTLMGTRETRLYHDHVLVKEAGTGQRTPWHQDQPYYNVDGRQNVSVWIPVDPVPRESTLEFVAGSHLGPWLMPRTFMTGEAKWFPPGSLLDLPDVEADRDAFPILGWELEPGDVVCFHMLTLHAAGGFRGPGRRRVLSLRFCGDDMVHTPRPWRTSPPFPGLADDLPAGAPLDHPLFPVVASLAWNPGGRVAISPR